MLKRIIFILLLASYFALFTLDVISQPSITWNKMYDGPLHNDEYAIDICDAGSGNYFVTGHTQGILYVLKINGFGDTLWSKLYNNYDDINDACVASGDGGCVVAGYGYIVKINTNGDVVWDVDSVGRLYDIIKTNDNGYIACGTTVFEGYIIKINSNGVIEWAKTYISGFARAYRGITIANDGGYLAVGVSHSTPSDTSRGLLTKIDDTGGVLWEKIHTIQNRYGNFASIVNIIDGYAVLGETEDSLGIVNVFANVFFARINNAGDLFFTKAYYTDVTEYARCLKKRGNNFIFSVFRGSLSDDSTYAKFIIADSNGITKRQNQVASKDFTDFNSLLPLSNGDIIFAGYSDFIYMGGNNDIHIIRTDSLLNFPTNIFGIEPVSSQIPQNFKLHQNYPNPFNPETKIMFELPINGFTKLVVYDILGREVATLVNEKLKAGIYEIPFYASFPSGVYFYKLSNGSYIQSKKMILIK